MATIDELRASIAAKRAEYHEKCTTETGTVRELREITEEVKRLSRELNAQIIAGAEPCEGCGELPIGMVQQIDVKGEPCDYFELGCAGTCRDKRAQGFTREKAVQKWNDERYLAPKKP